MYKPFVQVGLFWNWVSGVFFQGTHMKERCVVVNIVVFTVITVDKFGSEVNLISCQVTMSRFVVAKQHAETLCTACIRLQLL